MPTPQHSELRQVAAKSLSKSQTQAIPERLCNPRIPKGGGRIGPQVGWLETRCLAGPPTLERHWLPLDNASARWASLIVIDMCHHSPTLTLAVQ